jgi:four helix bundle protein
MGDEEREEGEVNSEELKERSKSFAHRCVNLAAALPKSDVGRVVSGQLIRSATSVASNYRAACLARSKPAFVAKISIVLEEADESAFWIEFAMEESLVASPLAEALQGEAVELTRIFAASRKTSSSR